MMSAERAGLRSNDRSRNTSTAMAQENVELHRQAFGAFNRRDWSAFVAMMDADVVGMPLAAAIDGAYLGHDGVRRWWASIFDTFPDFTVAVVDVRDLGDTTIAQVRTRGHGRGAGAPFEMTLWMLATWRHGKVLRWASHESEADALDAAASSE